MNYAKYLGVLSVFSLITASALPAQAISLNFPESNSNEDTGATAEADFSFKNKNNNVQLDLTVRNTTTTDPSQLTALAFDTPAGTTRPSPNFQGSSNDLDTLIGENGNVNVGNFGTRDLGVADDQRFLGGTGGPDGVVAGGSANVGITFDTALNASEVERKFVNLFSDPSTPVAQFQAIGNNDDLSDRVSADPVPFEAEGTMGLVALGGYLWYRNRKKRKQVLSQ